MRQITVHTWDELTRVFDTLDGWAFRGEREASWDLLSTLSRRLMQYCPDRTLWPEREARGMRIFRRKAHNYLPDPHALEDGLRCLALMQHHGAPTRLLDFTKSPFVATFFALEAARGEAAVFALDTPRVWSTPPIFDASLTRELIDPRNDERFARYFAPNEVPVLWVGEPAEMDRRLVSQSGVFVVPGVLHLTLDQLLAGYVADGSLLVKIVLPPSLRDDAMRMLYRMNITYATLFPDLDGLARSIGYEVEVVWQAPGGR